MHIIRAELAITYKIDICSTIYIAIAILTKNLRLIIYVTDFGKITDLRNQMISDLCFIVNVFNVIVHFSASMQP